MFITLLGGTAAACRKTGSAEKIATATMNACLLQAPTATPQLRYGSLANDNLERSGRAAAYQSEINGAPDAFGPKQPHDFPHARDRLSIPGRDDITDENSRTRGWSVRVDAQDQNAALASQGLRPIGRAFLFHGLKAGAEITAKNMSSCQELIDGAVDS